MTSTDNNQTVGDERKSRRQKDAFTRATSETLIVLLPFIVIGIALAHRGELRTIFFIPEWSIVSAVVVGQALVKVASFSIGSLRVHKEPVILIMSVLLVCLLVPILMVLAITLTSGSVSVAMATTQAAIFFISTTIFWVATALEAESTPRS